MSIFLKITISYKQILSFAFILIMLKKKKNFCSLMFKKIEKLTNDNIQVKTWRNKIVWTIKLKINQIHTFRNQIYCENEKW
mgnify:CR=1 FL=1